MALSNNHILAGDAALFTANEIRPRDGEFIACYLDESQDPTFAEQRYRRALSAAEKLQQTNSRETANVILRAIELNIANAASNFPQTLLVDAEFMEMFGALQENPTESIDLLANLQRLLDDVRATSLDLPPLATSERGFVVIIEVTQHVVIQLPEHQ
jgi:hypothetical protein